jgi:hypothetical protein
MMTQLQQELERKEEALKNLQEVVQETKKAKPFSIAIIEASTMVETTLVSSPSLNFSQEHLGDFEKHTKGIGSKY